MKTWTLPLLFTFACIGSSVSAGVEITDLGTLGGQWSDAYAINNFGQVVGLSQTASGSSHPFLYDTGKMIDLYPLNGQDSEPMGINNFGQVASGVIANDGIYYPAVYDNRNGHITIPGSFGGVNPGGVAGAAMAINSSDARWEGPPMVVMALLSSPGRALAKTINSLIDLAGTDGCTVKIQTSLDMSEIGADSRSTS